MLQLHFGSFNTSPTVKVGQVMHGNSLLVWCSVVWCDVLECRRESFAAIMMMMVLSSMNITCAFKYWLVAFGILCTVFVHGFQQRNLIQFLPSSLCCESQSNTHSSVIHRENKDKSLVKYQNRYSSRLLHGEYSLCCFYLSMYISLCIHSFYRCVE